MTMPRLQTVLLDPAGRSQATVLEVMEGVCRVYCPCEETEGMTLAFLQSGDRLRTDRLCSEAFQLPFRLTHDRFGELIGATRVTTTRLLSKWRQAELLEMSSGDFTMRFSPELIESAPLSF